jgi:hypothetical protein
LPQETRDAIIDRVQSFNVFTEDNDPYGEHDFGCFDLADYTIAWKIDYYDPEYQFHSPNPADPAKTRRVLTILLTEEY